MNSDDFTQLLQKGVRITLGASASLVENLQNSQKRTQNLSQLRTELDQLATEWAAKGEMTEQEARSFVQQLFNQLGNRQPTSPTADSPNTTVTTPTDDVAPEVRLEIQELTAQLAAIRAELEKLQESE
jgi:polyhydroxyalkanoate synthesis regulator phasin